MNKALRKEAVNNYLNLRRNFNDSLKKDFLISDVSKFSDEIWDFSSENVENRYDSLYTIEFHDIPIGYINFVKLLIHNDIVLKKNGISTCKTKVCKLKVFINIFIKNKKNIPQLISINDIKEVIYSKKNIEYQKNLLLVIKSFISLINEVDSFDYSYVLEKIDELDSQILYIRSNKTKNKYIPDNFLNFIVSNAINDIDNNSCRLDDRIFACLLVLMAETGMRIEDVTMLETNKLEMIKVNEKEIGYLSFKTFKGGCRETFTYLSELAKKAYENCEKLVFNYYDNLQEDKKNRLLFYLIKNKAPTSSFTKDERKVIEDLDNNSKIMLEKQATRYLWINSEHGRKNKSTGNFREQLKRFFVRHYNDLILSEIEVSNLENIKKFTINKECQYKKIFYANEFEENLYSKFENRIFYYVNAHMFRVTVCTKLFEQGVHIDFIVRHMNHLAEDMSDYYNQSSEKIHKDKEALEIFKNISTSDGLISTDNLSSDTEYYYIENIEKINDFLKRNKLNIVIDLNKIMKKLKKTNTTIAENEFGICIKSIISGVCERKLKFSNFQYSSLLAIPLETYKYIDLDYERFKEKLKIYYHNNSILLLNENYKNEVNRQAKALKRFMDSILIPEFELLESDLESKGKDKVIKENPNIKYIVNNINSIKGEINECNLNWTKK
ncbi:hypothetical protein [Clostridium sp.]|uniref:hypothetical protein n=1 Tax=Clostridium sp. TaxID=1506 RepID=UPI00290604D7|nr:hypothetical protein [Clostridium sp.]MDU7364100.1 hypothetical protein [Clostridium sp.]